MRSVDAVGDAVLPKDRNPSQRATKEARGLGTMSVRSYFRVWLALLQLSQIIPTRPIVWSMMFPLTFQLKNRMLSISSYISRMMWSFSFLVWHARSETIVGAMLWCACTTRLVGRGGDVAIHRGA